MDRDRWIKERRMDGERKNVVTVFFTCLYKFAPGWEDPPLSLPLYISSPLHPSFHPLASLSLWMYNICSDQVIMAAPKTAGQCRTDELWHPAISPASPSPPRSVATQMTGILSLCRELGDRGVWGGNTERWVVAEGPEWWVMREFWFILFLQLFKLHWVHRSIAKHPKNLWCTGSDALIFLWQQLWYSNHLCDLCKVQSDLTLTHEIAQTLQCPVRLLPDLIPNCRQLICIVGNVGA